MAFPPALAPEYIKGTGTLTVEKAVITPLTGAAAAFELNTDKSAVGDLATFQMIGEDSGTNATIYAEIKSTIDVNTDTSEDGSMEFSTMQAGTLTTVMALDAGVVIGAATGGDQGAGSINVESVYINGVLAGGGSGDVVGPAGATNTAIALYSGTTGKIIQDSSILVDGSSNVTGINNMTVTGDLTVNGTLTSINTTNLAVEDSLIQLAKANNATDVLDIGMVGLYDTSGSLDLYAGLFRDATDGKWNLFIDSQEDLSLSNTVNKAATGYTVGTLIASLEGNVTGTVSDISNHDTDGLSEGATNKYASTSNVDAAGAVMETDYNANTILAATVDDTPAALTVGASTFIGRKAAGNISAMSTTEARTLLNVADGAEVNLTRTTDLLTAGVDFTAGTSTTITLPANPGGIEANVDVEMDGLNISDTYWSLTGTTLTFTAIIPSYATEIAVKVWA